MKWTHDAVIAAIQEEAQRLGRTPKADHFVLSDGRLPSPNVCTRLFGSLRAAQAAAGLQPTVSGGQGRYPR